MSSLQTPASPRPPKPRRETHEYIEYEKYIDSQVARTRKNVKLVDLASATVVLVVALLGFFLTAAVLEHWILPGGLGTIGRVVMFVLLVAGVGHYAWHTLWPLVSRPINPEYAAVAIEREHPSLKNSLINFLLFRNEKGKMPPAVFDALEEQAAQRLAQSPVDDSIDRTPLVRWGYVLLGVLILGMVYTLASPKSTFDTARRVLMPWQDIATPSRVRITNITPGSAQVIQGDSLQVSARIRGLIQGEAVHLSYDTADRQHVEQQVPMSPLDELGTYGCSLPPDGDGGIQQDMTYRIVAGDGRSIDFKVTAVRAPSIRVQSVHYDFPDYTGYEDTTVEGRGDIRAIEGTKVTIVARSNGPIDTAHVDLDADGTSDSQMRVEGDLAKVTLELVLPRERQTPKSTSYQLTMLSPEGVANRRPPQHTLEILPDFKPEVEITEPAERSREVQLNETLVVRASAHDPDLKLSEVKLHFVKQTGEEVVVEPSLLEPTQPQVERLDGRWEFIASEYELKPGDVLEYWAEARDNCQPEANATITERKELVIVAPPAGEQNRNQQQGQQGEQGGQQGEGAQGEGQQQDGEQGQGQQGQGQQNQGQGQQGQGEQGGQQGQEQQGQGQEGQGQQQGQAGEGQQAGNQQGQNQQGQQGQNQGQQGEQGQQGQQGQNQGAQGEQGQQQGQNQQGAQGEGQQGAQGEQQGQQGQGAQRQGEQRPGEPGGGQGAAPDGSPEGQQQPGGGQGQPGQGQQRPVASDGSEDGRALEEMQRHLTSEEQQQATRRNAEPGEQGTQQPRQGQPGEGANPEGGQGSEQVPQGAQPPDTQPSGDRAGNNSAQSGSSPERKPGEQGSDPQAPAEGQAPRDQADGAGADSEGGAPQNEQTPTGQQPREGSQSAGGKQEGRQGNAGAGDQQDPQGAPESQQDADPRQKGPDAGPTDQSEDAEPPTPGHGKKESDSQGESGGDRPGGGEEGGGQKANREGTGSAGQNQAADEGGGQSQDQGPGDAGTEAGSSDEAGRETGQSGSKPGEGSRERQGQGSKPGGEQGADSQQSAQGEQKPGNEQQGAEQQARQQPGEGERGEQPGERGEQQGQEGAKPGEAGEQSQPGDERQQKPQNDSRSASEAGGQPGNTKPGENAQSSDDNSPNNQKYDLQEADKANLEYARKQTDLVLDTLDKQLKENKVDQELLDKLGWSEQDLRKFVDRWQSLRQKANQDTSEGQAAKVELDERLRKLGPKRGTVGGETRRTEDTLRDLGEGYQSEVPLKFRDKVKRYTEGISK